MLVTYTVVIINALGVFYYANYRGVIASNGHSRACNEQFNCIFQGFIPKTKFHPLGSVDPEHRNIGCDWNVETYPAKGLGKSSEPVPIGAGRSFNPGQHGLGHGARSSGAASRRKILPATPARSGVGRRSSCRVRGGDY